MRQRHEVVAVLDRSGSMHGQVEDVIGGFNTYITNIAKDSASEGVDTNVTLVLFDDKVDVVYASRSVESVEPLTRQVFCTRGSTALLDAVGIAIQKCKDSISKQPNALDNALDNYEPEQTTVTFAIFTDGEENASTKHSREEVAESIKELSDNGWTFLYLGADQDKWCAERAAGALNIAFGNTRAYSKSANDFDTTFSVMSAGTTKRLRDSKIGINDTVTFFAEAEAELVDAESKDNPTI